MKRRLKNRKKAHKNKSLAILRRPQFIDENIHRGRYLKLLEIDGNKISLNPPPIDIDATTDVIAEFSSPFGFLTGMGAGHILARIAEKMTTTFLKAIKEKADEEMVESKENP